jgi:heme-degrading monooxygenase HmoA
MICRLWRGWTALSHADAYEAYLINELFPRVERELRERGYRGYHLLRTNRDAEAEFVTMLWFESLEAVKSFAGENLDVPVISTKAKGLLSRFADRCEHYELSSFRSNSAR